MSTTGRLHQHPTSLAPTRRPRNLRRRRNRPIPLSSHAHSTPRLRRSQYALLLRVSGGLRDPNPLPRRTGAGWTEFRDEDGPGETARPADFHDYTEFQ